MADEDELESESEGSRESADAAALAIALGQAGNLDPRAAAYLEEQTRLARLQIERMEALDDHLDEERSLQLSHLRVRRFSDYSKMLLEIGIGLFLLAIVFGFGVMVWNAAHDRDLVIDAFTVPPDFSARGLTEQVVASELLDKFSGMEARTITTAQSEGTYRLDAGDAVHIEIPDTGGLSLGEIDRYLRQTLGNETHVAGEVVRTPKGLAVTVRMGGQLGARLEGSESDFDGLIQKAAESLFAQSEPLRYGDYLADVDRFDDAIAVLRPLSLTGSPLDRARALTSWAEGLDFNGHGREALPIVEQAVQLAPNASFAWAVVSDAEMELGHDEAARAAEVRMVSTAPETWSAAELASEQLRYLPFYIAQRGDGHAGDFPAAAKDWNRIWAGGPGVLVGEAFGELFDATPQFAAGHDLETARRLLGSAAPVVENKVLEVCAAYAATAIAYYAQDWPLAATSAAKLEAMLPSRGNTYQQSWEAVQIRPLYAMALARVGKFADASAIVAKTPEDCDLCARARGTIAALRHDWSTAEHWYALVAARTPSIPFADTDWGQMLLWKGDDAGAIAKFTEAHQIGPHFADPLEMWGEALMQENRSDLALAKFEEANKYAPNWGRLHLEWGKALFYAGKKDEAKKQFAQAAQLDLPRLDKAALMNWIGQHG
ncbi:MAG: hypothetical protein ABSD74_04470 [Rhizomicrobium sp.]|jgi:tetratricopeptide (TPR) repeat protein